jgi:cyclopropane fatty-acyl-phospholipid synthase-like methyltransferase
MTGVGMDRRDSSDVNRESYDAIAEEWDGARVRLSDAEARIFDLLVRDLAPGARILDLGCGTGRPIAEHLVARGMRVTGVDQSRAMLEIARRRMPGEEWVLSRLEDLEPEGVFAAAVAWDSLFHIPREAHAGILRRVRAVLPAGARVALTAGGSENPAFTDTMFERTFFYDSHAPDATAALLEELGFAIEELAFLERPTGGRNKGRVAIVAIAAENPKASAPS